MRLFGIAFLALVLAALAFLAVDRRHQIANGLAELADTGPETHNFQTAKSRLAANTENRLDVTFSMEGSNSFPALVGFPAYAKTSFPLPKSADALSGKLILDISADLEASAKGLLKISVNGSKRAAIVLEHARHLYEVRIELSTSDLALDRIVVSFATEGVTQKPGCARDWIGGSVLQINPTSRLKLRLTTPLTSLADRLAAAGEPAQVIWQPKANRADRTRLMGLAWAQSDRGKPVHFVSPEQGGKAALQLSPDDLTVNQTHAPSLALTSAVEWPVNLAGSGAIARAQHFDYQVHWISRFDLRALPNQEYPGAAHIGIDIDGAEEDLLLTVALNGSLVHSEMVPPAMRDIHRNIALPRSAFLLRNELTIRLTSAEDRQGDCARGRPKVAQLTSETRLQRGETPTDVPPDALTTLVQGDFALSVGEYLSATDAMSGLILLQKVVKPQTVTLHVDPQIGLPQIALLRAEKLSMPKHSQQGWVVLPSNDGILGSDFTLYQTSDPGLNAALARYQPRVVLLISAGQDLGG